MVKVLYIYNAINRLRERYYTSAIGKESLIKILCEAEISEQVYNSNAIENSTLTLEETEKILLQIDLDRYVNERETFEAEYNANRHENVIKRIARLHLIFEQTHPFVDGNGRIGRVINNYLLIREGFVPVNIKFIDRKMYYAAFEEFNEKDTCKIMEEIVGKALTNSYHKRLAYLEGARIVTLAEYAKEYKISHSNLINKAHRQTIEAFIEKGIWKIGINQG
jgi:prophage maintenance system killer protein